MGIKQINEQKDILYNTILLLSRNIMFYTKFNLNDTFQNRIHLIFIHISFLFIKIKHSDQKQLYKIFYQKMFDLIFYKIELNMREIGFGDTVINKNMKFLVKTFYSILLNTEKYRKKSIEAKKNFFNNFLKANSAKNIPDNESIIDYFNKYEAFCFDLSLDSVLEGEINFKYI